MNIRAVKIFFIILSKLILNQDSILLPKNLYTDHFGFRNFDFRFLLSFVNQQFKSGSYEVDFDGSNYASEVYFYSLVTSDFTETKKLILLK